MAEYSDLDTANALARRHDAILPRLKALNDLYEGEAPLAYLQPELQRELGDRLTAVSLGWPMLAVDPLEERLDPLGFRYPDAEEGDANLQRVWQDNDLDSEYQLGHIDALVMERAFIQAGTNPDDPDTPLVTVESPLEMYGEVDPRTRLLRSALRRWNDPEDFVRVRERHMTLYLPNKTVWSTSAGGGKWVIDEVDEHNLGECPVVALTNRARLADRYGRSQLSTPVLSLSNAANKIATDMMVGAEFHAIPLRAIFGIGPDDLKDAQGNRVSALKVIMGKLLTVPVDNAGDVKPHQFDASALTNFHDTLNQLARHCASVIGIPPHYMGLATDQPPSADAIRSMEARLVKQAERKQVVFGAAWEKAMRLVLRLQNGGEADPKARRLETIWRDASTPTRAQAADATAKMFQLGIATKRQAREDYGYTPGQITRMEAEDETAAAMDPVGQMTRAIGSMSQPVPAGA